MPTVDIDGVRVSFVDEGAGVPLVFVHGLVGSKEWFCYQASGLSDRYRMISYDLREARGSYTLDNLAHDLVRLFDRLKLPAVAIAGHELGSLVALKAAATYPERCLALVLSSATPSFAGNSNDDLLEWFSPGGIKLEGVIARLWRRVTGRATPQTEQADGLAYLARENGDIDGRTLRARLKLLRGTDIEPILAGIGVPALVIAGALDQPQLLAGAQRLAELLPVATLEVLEGADHFCFYTRHDLFNAVVDEFLADAVKSV